jgi:hypothetical protein
MLRGRLEEQEYLVKPWAGLADRYQDIGHAWVSTVMVRTPTNQQAPIVAECSLSGRPSEPAAGAIDARKAVPGVWPGDPGMRKN